MKNGSLHIIIVLCLVYLIGSFVAELLVRWRAWSDGMESSIPQADFVPFRY